MQLQRASSSHISNVNFDRAKRELSEHPLKTLQLCTNALDELNTQKKVQEQERWTALIEEAKRRIAEIGIADSPRVKSKVDSQDLTTSEKQVFNSETALTKPIDLKSCNSFEQFLALMSLMPQSQNDIFNDIKQANEFQSNNKNLDIKKRLIQYIENKNKITMKLNQPYLNTESFEIQISTSCSLIIRNKININVLKKYIEKTSNAIIDKPELNNIQETLNQFLMFCKDEAYSMNSALTQINNDKKLHELFHTPAHFTKRQFNPSSLVFPLINSIRFPKLHSMAQALYEKLKSQAQNQTIFLTLFTISTINISIAIEFYREKIRSETSTESCIFIIHSLLMLISLLSIGYSLYAFHCASKNLVDCLKKHYDGFFPEKA